MPPLRMNKSYFKNTITENRFIKSKYNKTGFHIIIQIITLPQNPECVKRGEGERASDVRVRSQQYMPIPSDQIRFIYIIFNIYENILFNDFVFWRQHNKNQKIKKQTGKRGKYICEPSHIRKKK